MENKNNIESEYIVIGSLITNFEEFVNVVDELRPGDFYDRKCSKIYEEMTSMFLKNEKCDLVLLAERIPTIKASQLAEINKYSVPWLATGSHIKIIKDKSTRRMLEGTLTNSLQMINGDIEIESVISELQSKIFHTSEDDRDDRLGILMNKVSSVQAEFGEKYNKGEKIIGYSCGISKIDDNIDGLRPSHIWILGGYTSMGKTQVMINMVNALIDQNVPTAVFSLEMSQVDLIARLIAQRLDVPEVSSIKVLKGKHDIDFIQKVEMVKGEISASPLWIHSRYFTLDKIKVAITKDFYKSGVKVFFIDYIQNIMNTGKKSEYESLTQIATDLQSLARTLGCTIVMVSQISNDRAESAGIVAGFKGSGAIEAVADLAIRLHRNKEEEPHEAKSVPLEIIIHKNRHGFTGKISDYNMVLSSGKLIERPLYEKH